MNDREKAERFYVSVLILAIGMALGVIVLIAPLVTSVVIVGLVSFLVACAAVRLFYIERLSYRNTPTTGVK